MPRRKSVILSPTEKKDAIKALKAEKQSAKAGLRVVTAETKLVMRDRKSQDREFNKRTNALTKQLASVETQLDRLAPPKTPEIALTL